MRKEGVLDGGGRRGRRRKNLRERFQLARSRDGIHALAEGIISLATGAREEDEEHEPSIDAQAAARVIAEWILTQLHAKK